MVINIHIHENYFPIPGSAIPPASEESLQPLIIDEDPRRYANLRKERKREEVRFSGAADRISTEDAALYESTLLRGRARPRQHKKSKQWSSCHSRQSSSDEAYLDE
ncbi:uncharacterized protein EAE97_000678 [Botrytis byssoidea]|uniref:Uncharacterized protein n=1 Tax=Botrytis byssoidea TaxID=139641 RepID=A0A9P5IYJ5_9HELO|nr:uncharacterized protein EAE97_000678 [Botrytis byssoidea]KAF7955419.1 hypothetical protein EAE97_000678 [Botrytis byssoidea]